MSARWLVLALPCLAALVPAYANEEIRVLESRQILPAPARGEADASHRLRLSLYTFGGSRWPHAEIEAAVRAAVPLLAQCGVALAAAELHVVQSPGRFHVYSTPVSRELLRRMPVRKPAIFLVDDTRNDPPFDAEAIGRANAATRPELADTIWVAHGARDLPQALAHELVHLLSDSGAHSDAPGNLMRDETAPYDTQLTPAQCELVRSQGTANGLLAADVANDGVVVSVDKAAKEIVIRHGRLNGFDMPPMTMVFMVKDERVLDRVKPGERIRFGMEIVDGRFTVTRIRRLR